MQYKPNLHTHTPPPKIEVKFLECIPRFLMCYLDKNATDLNTIVYYNFSWTLKCQGGGEKLRQLAANMEGLHII